MNLSHGYGKPPPFEESAKLLLRALDLGVTHFDTAALYGFGRNEELVGDVLAPHRARFTLASKCGLIGVDGKRVLDGRPATLTRTCEEAIKRLRTEAIDLYYLHRWDRRVPIEESVGALARLKEAGKIRAIGLSEVSAPALRRAHAAHPIAAVQSEYSLWTRNPEVAVLDACRELGVAFVAFSPLARGFLAAPLDPATFGKGDIRYTMPRFHPPHFQANRTLLPRFNAIAAEVGCTPGQLALARLLANDIVLPIPGTTSISHLEENCAAAPVKLTPAQIDALDALINHATVSGPRYDAAAQADVDTEEMA